MDFDDTPAEARFREEARAWLDANAPKHLLEELNAYAAQTTSNIYPPQFNSVDPVAASQEWQARKHAGGWACLQWPRQYGGRDASAMEPVIWRQEEGVYSQLSNLFTVGMDIVAPTIIAHGSEAQKQRYLKHIASGQEIWCQLFSEPSGGSDLAGLRTSAKRDGDDWIVNGQKIWTTHARLCRWGILILRTDPNVAKHQGLTMFIVDMKSPGLEIRPIREITGESHFNEVFFTDVRVADANRLGPVGGGWRVSLTTLMNERLSLASAIPTGVPEFFDLCCELETPTGLAIDDAAVRSRLATWIARASGLKYTSMRTLSAISSGRQPGPEDSIAKLVAGDLVQDLAAYALELQGPAGAVIDDSKRSFQKMLLSSPVIRIGGGTSEIQRNVIAEQVLGLPADIRIDKGVPFNQIPIGRK